MKFILGIKSKMTQVFDKDGVVHPATIVEAPASVITQVKTNESDGYNAVQVGAKPKKIEKINKPLKGHLKDLGGFGVLREFRIDDSSSFKIGDKLTLEQFKEGDFIQGTAITKGKGFQGVVKRHGFAGGPRTHGQKHSEREPGSIGGGLRNKVPKKMRMAGRMGGDIVTVKNLKVLHVDMESGRLYVKGALPGRPGTIVEIRG